MSILTPGQLRWSSFSFTMTRIPGAAVSLFHFHFSTFPSMLIRCCPTTSHSKHMQQVYLCNRSTWRRLCTMRHAHVLKIRQLQLTLVEPDSWRYWCLCTKCSTTHVRLPSWKITFFSGPPLKGRRERGNGEGEDGNGCILAVGRRTPRVCYLGHWVQSFIRKPSLPRTDTTPWTNKVNLVNTAKVNVETCHIITQLLCSSFVWNVIMWPASTATVEG